LGGFGVPATGAVGEGTLGEVRFEVLFGKLRVNSLRRAKGEEGEKI
jgi:hypothetical protein